MSRFFCCAFYSGSTLLRRSSQMVTSASRMVNFLTTDAAESHLVEQSSKVTSSTRVKMNPRQTASRETNSTTSASDYRIRREKWIETNVTSKARFVPMAEREDTSQLTADMIKAIEPGKYKTNWRGMWLCKNPFDLIIYQSMVWDIQPATIIEIGTFEGGTALWLADLIKTYGMSTHVYSFDNDFSTLHKTARDSKGITFLEGDCFRIGETFTAEFLQSLPRPWIIIEDAHVNVLNVLEYFFPFMRSGDYVVVEDSQPDLLQNLEDTIDPTTNFCKTMGTGKMEQIRTFVDRHPAELKVDTLYNDHFGYNVTWNMNGFIRRM